MAFRIFYNYYNYCAQTLETSGEICRYTHELAIPTCYDLDTTVGLCMAE